MTKDRPDPPEGDLADADLDALLGAIRPRAVDRPVYELPPPDPGPTDVPSHKRSYDLLCRDLSGIVDPETLPAPAVTPAPAPVVAPAPATEAATVPPLPLVTRRSRRAPPVGLLWITAAALALLTVALVAALLIAARGWPTQVAAPEPVLPDIADIAAPARAPMTPAVEVHPAVAEPVARSLPIAPRPPDASDDCAIGWGRAPWTPDP